MRSARRSGTVASPRAPLSKERVLRAAVALADEHGIDGLSMRKLGQAVGVEAMSLYNHAANKDDILDGIVEAVIAEIEIVAAGPDWKAHLRARSWPLGRSSSVIPGRTRVLETRTMPGRRRWATSRRSSASSAGVGSAWTPPTTRCTPWAAASSASSRSSSTRWGSPGPSAEEAAVLAGQMAERFPYITELAMAVSHEGGLGGCDDDIEFAFGLDLILDGLERYRDRP